MLTLRAPAKINLHLAVLGRRSDGLHRIETVFQTVDLCDSLYLLGGPAGVHLHCTGETAADAPAGEDNLAVRAARAWHAAAGSEPGLRIGLCKRIPAGAGLGGGSSDAAAVLRGLQALHPRAVPADRIHRIAADLGADVAFFLLCGTAHGSGRGERLQALPDLPERPCTLYMPDTTCPTGAVYQALHPDERQGLALGPQALAAHLASEPPVQPHNALEAAAVRIRPAVGALLEDLRRRHGPAAMSGSGSCCFVFGHHPPLPGTRSWQVRFLPAQAARACAISDQSS